MNKKTLSYTVSGGILILVVVFLIGRFTAPGGTGSESSRDQSATSTTASKDTTIWTCSMHPQIQQPGPGACPICGMALIPVAKDAGANDGPRTYSMSESSKALANIQTTIVEKRFPEAEIRLVGKLQYDETKVKSLTARFPARIDELYVNYIGIAVKQGEHLARVYSPELLTAQSELLTSYRYDPNGSGVRSAREKLRLWDLLPDQIEEIIANGEAKDFFDLKAPIGGVVVSKELNEGDYVKTGQSLLKIVDLSQLWLELEAYESDLAWLRFGQTIEFSVEAYPGQIFSGQIVFIEPEIDRMTRTVSVRVNVPNSDMKLKPGMFARAIAYSKVAAAGKIFSQEFAGKWVSPMHPEIVKEGPGKCDICGMDLVPAEALGYVQTPNESPPLVVPASAVLRTGKRAVVYVEIPDTEFPTYEGREIEIGSRAADVYVVVSGLKEGDRVVTQGAFKIDSSLQIQAKPSMMNPETGRGAQGAGHGHNHEGTGQAMEAENLSISTDMAKKILPLYLKLQSSLAGDDLQVSKEQLKAMMEITGHAGPLPDLMHTMLAGETLDTLRKPHFDTLSTAMIAAVKADSHAFEGDLYQMHCPMVYGSTGADWLQATDDLQNPYFGASMLTCGEVKGIISGTKDEGQGTRGEKR